MAHPRLIERPIFVIGCNRSGTTLLFRTLCAHPLLWTHYEESQHVYHRLFPVDAEWGEAVPEAAPPEVADALVRALYREAHNKEYFKDRPILGLIPRKALQTPVNPLYKGPPLRLVEKTPANCFRIPLLATAFPDARFLFLVRRPEDTISSLMDGWKRGSARVILERDSHIEDHTLRQARWHYLVPPGWARWLDEPLERTCAYQWISSVTQAWEDLHKHCSGRFHLLRHEDALDDPVGTYREVLAFCEMPHSDYFERSFPHVQKVAYTHGGSGPEPEKWKRHHREEIESVRPMFEEVEGRFYGMKSS